MPAKACLLKAPQPPQAAPLPGHNISMWGTFQIQTLTAFLWFLEAYDHFKEKKALDLTSRAQRPLSYQTLLRNPECLRQRLSYGLLLKQRSHTVPICKPQSKHSHSKGEERRAAGKDWARARLTPSRKRHWTPKLRVQNLEHMLVSAGLQQVLESLTPVALLPIANIASLLVLLPAMPWTFFGSVLYPWHFIVLWTQLELKIHFHTQWKKNIVSRNALLMIPFLMLLFTLIKTSYALTFLKTFRNH